MLRAEQRRSCEHKRNTGNDRQECAKHSYNDQRKACENLQISKQNALLIPYFSRKKKKTFRGNAAKGLDPWAFI